MAKIFVLGDVCMRNVQHDMDDKRVAGLLADVRPLLSGGEIVIANLENAICAPDAPINKCGPNLWQTPENLNFFRQAGVDLCVLANNHTGDFGPEGMLNTLRVLDNERFGHVGGGVDIDDAYSVWYADTSGGRMAVCAFCENEFGGATLSAAGSAAFDWQRAARAIRLARENADFALVIMHGGNEYNPLPSPRVVARYRTFVELGAHAVVGMHPHCPQGYEIYRGAPIVYSPGNFLFHNDGDSGNLAWHTGYIVEFNFQKGENVSLALHPYRFNRDLTLIRLMRSGEREKMLAYIARISSIIADEREIERYFDGWCTITGPSHARHLYDEKYIDLREFPVGHAMYSVRNIHTCEAHDELVTNLMRMILENRVDEGKKTALKIRELQKMPV